MYRIRAALRKGDVFQWWNSTSQLDSPFNISNTNGLFFPSDVDKTL